MAISSSIPSKLILGSGSPRRAELLEFMGYAFEVRKKDADESAPSHLKPNATAKYLAEKKAAPFLETLGADELLITCDTEVWLGKRRLGKPANAQEAHKMLESLSGRAHKVISGVALTTTTKQVVFAVKTKVYFRKLAPAEIEHYITTYKPFDKAGAYGIQEWIGMVGIEKIKGCYYNVVGLPAQALQVALKQFNYL